MSFIKKENLTIIVGEYQDQQGNSKKQYKTIGELITMNGNSGPYQFFRLWGPGGVTEGKVFEQTGNGANSTNQAGQQFAPAPANRGAVPHQQNAPARNAAGSHFDDDIPFN